MGKLFTKLNSFTRINIAKGTDISVFYEKNTHKPSKEDNANVNTKFFGDPWNRSVAASVVNNLDVYVKIGETYLSMDGRTFNALVNVISTSWQEYSYSDKNIEFARTAFIDEILAQTGLESFDG